MMFAVKSRKRETECLMLGFNPQDTVVTMTMECRTARGPIDSRMVSTLTYTFGTQHTSSRIPI